MRFAGLIILIAVSGAASAQALPLEKAIADCAVLSGSPERLTCYDALAARLRSASSGAPSSGSNDAISQNTPAVPSAPSVASAAAVAPAPIAAPATAAVSPVALFGAETLSKSALVETGAPKPLDQIEATVVSLQFAPNGRFIVTLDNGQVWRQQDGDTGRARFSKSGGDRITISRSYLTGYNLVIASRTGLFKVMRQR